MIITPTVAAQTRAECYPKTQEIIRALGSYQHGHYSTRCIDFPIDRLIPRPMRSGENRHFCQVLWQPARPGHRLPAELGVIRSEGGR